MQTLANEKESDREMEMVKSAVSKIDNTEDIVKMIVEGEWEEVLFSLTQDMDPWDIDLIELSKRFMVHIKKTSEMDLRIPGKILLAAAVIYRMKTDCLEESREEEISDEIIAEERFNVNFEGLIIPPLTIPLIRKPRRAVSLDELVRALNKAMKIRNRREATLLFQVQLHGEDITEKIEELFKKICSLLEKYELLRFSEFTKEANKGEKLKTFILLLHLSNQERVHCSQQEMFGEIFVRLNGMSHDK